MTIKDNPDKYSIELYGYDLYAVLECLEGQIKYLSPLKRVKEIDEYVTQLESIYYDIKSQM